MSGAKKPSEAQHELLCAYILGEADANGRAELEAALAESADLRAEKERIEGTIGLVRDVYGSEPTLSEQALAELMRAAGGGASQAPVLSFWSRPAFRAAAAVVAMAGGVWGLIRFAETRDTGAPSSLEVAQAEPESAVERVYAEVEELTLDARERQVELGLGSSGEPIAASAEEPRPDPRGKDEAARGLGKSPSVEAPAPVATGAAVEYGAQPLFDTQQQLVEAAKVIQQDALEAGRDVYGGVRFEPPATPGEQVLVLGERLEKKSAVSTDAGVAALPGNVWAIDPLPGTALGQPAAPPITSVLRAEVDESALPAVELHAGTELRPTAVAKGADEFFLGRGEATQGGQEDRRARAEGLYRGAGDTVPPGGAGGGGAQGPAGPASSGPASPGAPARVPQGGPATPSSGAGAPSAQSGAASQNLRYRAAPETRTVLGRARVDLEAMGYASGEESNEAGVDLDGNGIVDGAVEGWLGGADDKRDYGRYKAGLTPVELQQLVERECRRRIRSCYPRPSERPSMMYFRFWGDNAFELAQLDALSTFSVDVDTASYALARRYLEDGILPEKAQIRTEEFLNYFEPDLDPPTEETFAITTELAPSLFGGREDRWMLRVGVRGREVSATERKPLALTFVVDTSGSMKEGGRLELVKHALRLLLGELDARDSIAVVAFSREARLILPMTSAAQRGLIESAIYPLSPDGGTNAEAGLKMGYELALSGLASGVHNRVVLLSDGVANIGQTDQDRLNADVKRHKDQGIYLNTIGVGMNNHNDVFLEQLADKGDGICDYIDDAEAARRAIVDRFTGAFEPIASDVKIQVEFDPNQVHRYRLLGYENRAIADQDFRNDKVDAGEVGAGHQVVALYEIERTSAAADGPIATVRLRWKAPKMARQDPNEVDVTEIEQAVLPENAAGSFGAASPGYRRSVLVAQFAEFLRRSTHTLGDSYETLIVESAKLDPELADPDFTEFRGLVERAASLIVSQMHPRSDLDRALDEFRRFQILQAELKSLKRDSDSKLLEDLQRKNQELEDALRHMIRKDVEERNG